jgi:hypothetical protein
MTRKRNAFKRATELGRLDSAPMSPSTRETAETIAVQRRPTASIARLEQVDPDAALLIEYRTLNAQIIREIRAFRAHAELALWSCPIRPDTLRVGSCGY